MAISAIRTAGLTYVSDDGSGLTRHRRGKSFYYRDLRGRIVRDAATLARIKALAIPPAWEKVWICPAANGHIQATGRDARGRKQYRYHTRWRETRDGNKYAKMVAFGQVLPRLRRRVDLDLRKPGLPRDKVLATIVRLLETTFIRVGNEEYARQNDSFGLTTLRSRHVTVRGAKLRFQFRGKSGVKHAIDLTDSRLARIVKRCQELTGQELFRYESDDGSFHLIHSHDVNGYLQDACGDEFTAKDFRTWAGTVMAASALELMVDEVTSATVAKRLITVAVEGVSERLGNTKAVCRKCYIHPAVLDAFTAGTLRKGLADAGKLQAMRHLSAHERRVLAFLSKSRAHASRAG